MSQVVERRGALALLRSDGGFAWTLPVSGDEVWYWHPDQGRFTLRPCVCPSPDRASEGLFLLGESTIGRRSRDCGAAALAIKVVTGVPPGNREGEGTDIRHRPAEVAAGSY